MASSLVASQFSRLGASPSEYRRTAGDDRLNEARTWAVAALTAVTMIIEIVVGSLSGSLALSADGWEMSTHLSALVAAAVASRMAHRLADDRRFSFGPGKIGDLAAFASAMILASLPIVICTDAVEKLRAPAPVDFSSALPIAALGLAVNVISLWILRRFGRSGRRLAAQRNLNFRAADAHVCADALTSVLAVGSLLGGRFLGWEILDPIAGFVGAAVIAAWSISLLCKSGATLLDMTPDRRLLDDIRASLEAYGDRVVDLRLWRAAPGELRLAAKVARSSFHEVADYRRAVEGVHKIAWVNIEIVDAGPLSQCLEGGKLEARP